MKLERLQWDSDFFGREIGRIEVGTQGVSSIRDQLLLAWEVGFELVYVFSQDLLVGLPGAQLVDEKVAYRRAVPYATTDSIAEPIRSVSATAPVTSRLQELGILAGHHSRFRVDPRFTKAEFEKLYVSWVERSVVRAFADEVLVWEDDGKAVGLITGRIRAATLSIGLISVLPEYQGRGIGAQLIDTLEFSCRAHAALSSLTVATQRGNLGACRFYERSGFEVDRVDYVYHVWAGGAEREAAD